MGDVFNSEIDVYNPNTREFIRSYGSFSSPVEGRLFFGPGGMSFGQDGNVYVTDFSQDVIKLYNGRVQVIDLEGNFLFAFGTTGSKPGQFRESIGIELDESENIYVADSQNSRVQVFDKDGNLLTVFGQPARNAAGEVVPPPALGGSPFGDPLNLTPGVFNWAAGTHYNDGKLYVGDFFQGRIQVLTVNGN